LLARRDYTASEITQRLLDRGYAVDDVGPAVATLTDDGTIDDRRTALAHVRTAARIKGRGALRIRRELEARGIAPLLVREALDQLSPDDDLLAIQRLLERRRVPRPIPADQRRRLFQQCLRRGFPADLVARALAFDPTDE
jgi:regulatory protein